jgi:hypothetical protein
VLSPGKIRAHGSHGGKRGVATITVNLNTKLKAFCVRPTGAPYSDEVIPSAEASSSERPAEKMAEKGIFDRILESVKTAAESVQPDKAALSETAKTGGVGASEAPEPESTVAALPDVAGEVTPAKGGFKVIKRPGYQETLGGVSVRPSLKRKVIAMAQELIASNLVTGNITLTSGMRGLAKAHRWSTAYAIRQGRVSFEKLKSFRNSKAELGKDEDGNIWYKRGWTKAQVLANAKEKWSGALAAEGYKAGDPRREPNTYPNVTPHAAGRAIDMIVPWKAAEETAHPAKVEELKRRIKTKYKGRPDRRDKALSTIDKFLARGSYSDLAAEMTAKHGLTRTMLYKKSTEDWHYQEEKPKR